MTADQMNPDRGAPPVMRGPLPNSAVEGAALPERNVWFAAVGGPILPRTNLRRIRGGQGGKKL